jgi:hypothetical protein
VEQTNRQGNLRSGQFRGVDRLDKLLASLKSVGGVLHDAAIDRSRERLRHIGTN